MTRGEFAAHVEACGVDLSERGGDGKLRGSCPACAGDPARTFYIGGADLQDKPTFGCFAGCDGGTILEGLGLTWREFYGDQGDTTDDAEAIRHALLEGAQKFEDAGADGRQELEGGCGLLWRAQALTIFGDRGSGKSAVALLLGMGVAIAGGRALYLDCENGPAFMRPHVDGALEANDWPDVVEDGRLVIRHWPQVDPGWAPDGYGEAVADFDLVVYDSLREFISMLGGDPNVDKDISKFIGLCVTPVISRGGTAIVCDNTGHENPDRPKGAGAKLDAIPAALKADSSQHPFGPDRQGRIELRVTRSRFGDVGREFYCVIGNGTWELPATLTKDPGERAREAETAARQRFAEACQLVLNGQPMGRDALLQGVRDTGVKGGEAKLRRWVKDLVDDPDSGFVQTPKGVAPTPDGPRTNTPDKTPGQTPYVFRQRPPEEGCPGGVRGDEQTAAAPVYFDCETGGLDPRRVELKTVTFGAGDELEMLRHPEQREAIQAWLDRPGTFVAHNIKFDLAFIELNGYRVPPPERWDDTVLLAHVAGARMPGQTELSRLVKAGVAAGDLPDDALEPEKRIKRWVTNENRRRRKAGQPTIQKGNAPRDVLEPYALADVRQARWVHEHYGAQVNGQHDILDLERRLLPVLYDAEQRGIPLDLEAAKRFRVSVNANMEQRLAELRELAEMPGFNPHRSVHLAEAFERRGVDLERFPHTPTGQPCYKADVLDDLIEHWSEPFASALRAYRREKKMRDYAEGLFEHSHGDRLHTSWKQVGAATGRMSSSPNVQNLPKADLRVRYLVAAPPGKVLVAADLDQVEMRLLGHYARGALQAAFAAGADVHQQTADRLGITRDQAKTLNYSIQYGCGSKRVANILDSDAARGRRVLDGWYDAYPEVRGLRARLEARLKERGHIKSVLGRCHELPWDRKYILLNRLIQGSAADLFKASAIELPARGFDAVVYCHDEIVVEVAEDRADDAAAAVSECLCSGPVPGLTAEAKVIARWSDAKQPGWAP